MTIVGFNFNRMEIERKAGASGKINVSNSVSIKDVLSLDLSGGMEKQKAVKFIFEFTSQYEPDIGGIKLLGEIVYLDESAKITKILSEWKKDKKIDKKIMADVYNTALGKCNIEALVLSREVNLPSPIPLPKVKMEE